eukprot:Pgem_evm1s15266
MKYGVTPTDSNESGVVLKAECRFCKSFGRISTKLTANKKELGNKTAPKGNNNNNQFKKEITTLKIYDNFRSDYFTGHLKSQHGPQWEAYQKLTSDEEKEEFLTNFVE